MKKVLFISLYVCFVIACVTPMFMYAKALVELEEANERLIRTIEGNDEIMRKLESLMERSRHP